MAHGRHGWFLKFFHVIVCCILDKFIIRRLRLDRCWLAALATGAYIWYDRRRPECIIEDNLSGPALSLMGRGQESRLLSGQVGGEGSLDL